MRLYRHIIANVAISSFAESAAGSTLDCVSRCEDFCENRNNVQQQVTMDDVVIAM